MHFGELVRRHSLNSPHKTAVIDRGARLSYAELNYRTDCLAAAFAARELAKGDRLAFIGENGLTPYELMIACTKAGIVYVPIDFRLSGEEVLKIIASAGPEMMFVGQNHLELMGVIRDRAGSIGTWVACDDPAPDGYLPYSDLLRTAPDQAGQALSEPDDPFCILYTSGSTGAAKGVVLTHANTLHNGLAVAKSYEIGAESTYLVTFPYSATGTVNHGCGPTLMMGGTVVFEEQRHFDAERYFNAVATHRVTHNQLVPTMLYRLLESPLKKDADLSSIEVLGYGSAPIPPHRVRQLVEDFGPVLLQAYGMTETCSLATVLERKEHLVYGTDREHLLASCGRPVAEIDVRIIGAGGEPVAAGEPGEIALRGPWFTGGYWNDPQRTAELLRDGWLYTGDVGRLDNEGYLYVVDRKKDLIITGGANVASAEVEAVIYAHPGVSEVAVIGLPDAQWGERIHAVVVRTPDSGLEPGDIIAHCKRTLTGYKCPKTVDFIDVMPKTSTGKPSKPALREWAGRRLLEIGAPN